MFLERLWRVTKGQYSSSAERCLWGTGSDCPRMTQGPSYVSLPRYELTWPFSLAVGFIQFSSVQSCLTLHDPMDHSTPGLPVHHQLLEFTQTVHWVGDAIQPSHLSSPSHPTLDPSQHQGLFQWVNSLPTFAWGDQSIGVSASASVPPMNTQDWSLLGWTGWLSLQSKGLSRVFSNTTV